MFLWAIYTMAMFNNQRVGIYIYISYIYIYISYIYIYISYIYIYLSYIHIYIYHTYIYIYISYIYIYHTYIYISYIYIYIYPHDMLDKVNIHTYIYICHIRNSTHCMARNGWIESPSPACLRCRRCPRARAWSEWDGFTQGIVSYPPVNIQKTTENHHFIAGKINYREHDSIIAIIIMDIPYYNCFPITVREWE